MFFYDIPMGTKIQENPNDSGAFDLAALKLGSRGASKREMAYTKEEAERDIRRARKLSERLSTVGTESESLFENEESGEHFTNENESIFGDIHKLIAHTEELVKKAFDKNNNRREIKVEIEKIRGEGGRSGSYEYAVKPDADSKSTYRGLEDNEHHKKEIMKIIKGVVDKIDRIT